MMLVFLVTEQHEIVDFDFVVLVMDLLSLARLPRN